MFNQFNEEGKKLLLEKFEEYKVGGKRRRRRKRKGGVKTIKLPPRKKTSDLVKERRRTFREKGYKKSWARKYGKSPTQKLRGKQLSESYDQYPEKGLSILGRHTYSTDGERIILGNKWKKLIENIPKGPKRDKVMDIIKRKGSDPRMMDNYERYLHLLANITEEEKKSIFSNEGDIEDEVLGLLSSDK